jgi:prepilin-type N-terminal cleavage/methylation domain-containing protein
MDALTQLKLTGPWRRKEVSEGPMTRKSQGFSIPELMIVVGISTIILSVALPSVTNFTKAYRLTSDLRGIAAQIHLARMRSASDFTKAEVYFDTTNSTYQVRVWSQTAGTWVAEGGAQPLSQGMAFGYGSLTTSAGGQATIAQTTQIIFNSRGFSVDGSGSPTGNSVVYFTNNSGAYGAVSVSVAGEPTAWKYSASAWVPQW